MNEPVLLRQQPDDILVGCSDCEWTHAATGHQESFWWFFAHSLVCEPIRPVRVPWWRRFWRRHLATTDPSPAGGDEARRHGALGLVGLGDPCWGPCDPDCEIGSSHCYGDHLPRPKADWLEHVPPCPAAGGGSE